MENWAAHTIGTKNLIIKNDSFNPRTWDRTNTGACKQYVEQRDTFKKSLNNGYLYQKIIPLKIFQKTSDEEMKKWYWNGTVVPIDGMRDGIFELGLKITLKMYIVIHI